MKPTLKRIIPLLLTAALLLTGAATTPAKAQEQTAAPVPYGLTLLKNQETELIRIVNEGPGPGSPEQKEAIRGYRAIQRFLQMAQTRGNEDRFQIFKEEDGIIEAFDTKALKSLLESRNGKLIYYDPSLVPEDNKTVN